MTFFQNHLLSSKLTNSKLFTRIFANYFLTLDEFYWYTDWGTFRAYDKDERWDYIVEYGDLPWSRITWQEVKNVQLSIVLVLVRGGVCLLVVGVDVLLGVLALLVVGVVLPVAVLHHLALSQVRWTLHKLRKPAAKQQMYREHEKFFLKVFGHWQSFLKEFRHWQCLMFKISLHH